MTKAVHCLYPPTNESSTIRGRPYRYSDFKLIKLSIGQASHTQEVKVGLTISIIDTYSDLYLHDSSILSLSSPD